MKRTIYVIRDSVSGRYYSGRSHFDWDGEFSQAVIHTTLPSVRTGVRSRLTGWRHIAEQRAWDKAPVVATSPWVLGWKVMVEVRETLPFYGMTIESHEIDGDKGVNVPVKA